MLTLLPAAPRVEIDPDGPAGLTLEVPAAQAQFARSSGGYRRPGGFIGRTPSVGRPGPVSRTPSLGGGYRRPGAGGGLDGVPWAAPPSAGDRAQSRRLSREALERYRTPGEAVPAPGSRPVPGVGGAGAERRRGPWGDWYPDRRGGRTWTPPPYALRSPPAFGIWDALFLWFLFDTLATPGHTAFFHHHQDDPGYREWRAEAERRAAEDPELRARLAELDARLAAMADQPRDPDYLPPDVAPERALAEDRPAPSGGIGVVTVATFGGMALFVLWLGRQQHRATPARSGGGRTMDRIRSAGNILRHKLSGETYAPALFRVGMTLTVDPTPFILLAGRTKVGPPRFATAGATVSVAEVATLADGAATLHRLYLPEEQGFFQIHLDSAGHPDECRFFAPLDEVHPASPEEWGFWLDSREGLIGWPEFQTKDGQLYHRIWAPGPHRVPPHTLYETGTTARGMTVRTRRAMLYGRPTGAAPPAPQTEYLLVEAVEQDQAAWVAIHVGLDVNPAALSFA